MQKKLKVLVLSGYGLNCEEETKLAFEMAGAGAEIVHINDLIDNPKLLDGCKILAVPGGFSFGDHTGSGNAFAHKLKSHLWEEALSFAQKDRLIIGVCNGFQILVNLGLIPATLKKYGERQVALLHNDSARYTVRWVDLAVGNSSPWLSGIKKIFLPVAHGEGKLYAPTETLKKIKKDRLVALTYYSGEICKHFDLPKNPNGSALNIAALTDGSGRILGVMPHPERALFFTQLPHWTFLKEKYLREKKKIPQFGPGLKIFQNAVNYFL